MAGEMTVIKANIATMKKLVDNKKTIERVTKIMGEEEAGAFLASCLDLYTSDNSLVECDPTAVMQECLKAAALKLPVMKSLGFAYVLPFKRKGVPVPTFLIGYKGLLQLAQRTGQYRYINADVIFEGEEVKYDRITSKLEIKGEAESDNVVGYFGYFQLLNGFEKAVYWSKERVTKHAQKYSKSWNDQRSPWHTSFDEMALKTVLKQIISRYGIMSIELAGVVANDEAEQEIEREAVINANGAPIMLPRNEAGVDFSYAGATERDGKPLQIDMDGEIPDFSVADVQEEPDF